MTPWVTRLIIANVLVYLLKLADPSTLEALAFVPARILERPWTLVTYMFMHGDLGHIAFNMLGLIFFGPRLEAFLDEKRFLLLYGISGLIAALLSAVLSPMSAIIGASGAVYGVFFGFARYWPREIIRVWGIFPIEARWMVVLMTALSLYGGLGMTMDNIAHFAHLGGFVGAYLYLHFLERSLSRRKTVGATTAQISKNELQQWAGIDRETLHEVNREELDRIRKKINTSGTESLTPGEREFMDRFSSRGGE